jgi:hypothetical protein
VPRHATPKATSAASALSVKAKTLVRPKKHSSRKRWKQE